MTLKQRPLSLFPDREKNQRLAMSIASIIYLQIVSLLSHAQFDHKLTTLHDLKTFLIPANLPCTG